MLNNVEDVLFKIKEYCTSAIFYRRIRATENEKIEWDNARDLIELLSSSIIKDGSEGELKEYTNLKENIYGYLKTGNNEYIKEIEAICSKKS